MPHPLSRVSHLAIAAAAFGILSIPRADAADINVPPNTTTQQSFGGNDRVTVGTNATMTSTASPTLNQTSIATGVVIDNSGTIQSTGTGARAIRFNVGTAMTFTLTNRAGGTIQSQNDALQVGQNVTSGTIVVNNFGTIQSTGTNANNGQAIDFNSINPRGGTASVTVNNFAGGLLSAADSDAIRPGSAGTVNNYGRIVGNNFMANTGADGIDFQTSTSGTVNNYAGGTIEGGRHGINIGYSPGNGATNNATTSQVVVFNAAGGTIIGHNGSGFGSDVSGTVVNYGTISGRADPSPNPNVDGDGVDIDYFANITNYGLIEATGARGVGNDGLANSSQGVSIGAGTVLNKAGGTIRGQADGILVDNSSQGPAFGSVTIDNAGTIEGTTGYGISITSNFNNTITNSGTITGGNGRAIVLGAGNDTLNIRTGSVINGTVDGGAGYDTIALAGTGTFAGAINFERLDVTSGRWTLTGNESYSSGIGVASGAELNAPGTIASVVTVAQGGRVSGVGTLGGLDLAGTLAPGNSIGTLAVSGNAIFRPSAIYQVQVNAAGRSDKLAVAGTAALDGTVAVEAARGNYAARTRYQILTAAGGVTGRFASVSTDLAFLTPTLSYDPTSAYLTLRRNKALFTDVAQSANQLGVAGAFNSAPTNDRRFIALTGLSASGARAAFDSLSGEGIAAAQNVANRSTQLFTSSIFDQTTFYAGGGAANSVTLTERLPGSPTFFALAPTERAPIRELADLPASRVAPVAPPVATRTWRAWATGFGGVENISGNRGIGSASQRNDIYGGALGVDYQLTPDYLLGVAVGGSNGNFRVDQRGTTGSTTGGHIAIYDLYELGNWYGASSSSFSYFGNQTTRFVSGFGGLGTEQNRGNFNSNEFRSRLEIGRHFAALPAFANLPAIAGFGTVTPFVAIELASLRSNGFTETPLKGGAGLFRLNVSGQSASSAPGFVGLRFQRVTQFGGGMVLSPTLQMAYAHEFAPYRNQIGTLASLPGSTFLVDGARPARDAAQVKAGAELAIGPRSAIFANFDGEFSGINQLYAGKGGFRYVW